MAKSKRTKPLKQRPAFKTLRKLLNQSGRHDLLWYHRAGKCVETLFPREGGRRYGEGRMTAITTALRKSDNFANNLWEYRDFSTTYDRGEVRQLCKEASTGGFRLTWTHVKHLLSLDDSERIGFQHDCINAEWSSKELHRAIKEYRGRKSAGGKPFDRPKTLDAGLRQIIYESNTWIRRHRQVWFDADRPVIDQTNEQENPEQIPELLGEAIECWEEMEWLTKKYLPRLRQMRAWFKREAIQKAKRTTAKRAKPKKKAPRKR
ncbi:MAG: hypothetical protein IH991_05825 [Planctomycetes bacterium]|nr:hypothetical protein [Planctomycetota bacterium]